MRHARRLSSTDRRRHYDEKLTNSPRSDGLGHDYSSLEVCSTRKTLHNDDYVVGTTSHPIYRGGDRNDTTICQYNRKRLLTARRQGADTWRRYGVRRRLDASPCSRASELNRPCRMAPAHCCCQVTLHAVLAGRRIYLLYLSLVRGVSTKSKSCHLVVGYY